MDGQDIVYKIATRDQWAEAKRAGVFKGAPVDLADGYIHFSTPEQVRQTAAKHFAGQADLLLIAIRADALGDKLVYERSRGGDLFPHLYAELPIAAALSIRPLPLGEDGLHQFPDDATP